MPSKQGQYSSIAARFPVWLRQLPNGDSPSLYYEYTAFAHDSLENSLSSGLPEGVAEFLIEMNNKLDSILGMLSFEDLCKAFPTEVHCSEVGGSGVNFTSDIPFEDGAYVEAVLVLCRIPLRLAGAVGKLAKIPGASQDATESNWRLNFTRIREKDLETVIRFVIQEERRIIRQKKWD